MRFPVSDGKFEILPLFSLAITSMAVSKLAFQGFGNEGGSIHRLTGLYFCFTFSRVAIKDTVNRQLRVVSDQLPGCNMGKSYLLTDRSLTLLRSFNTSSMFGISVGFESKIAWPSPLFALRSFIKSMAETVLWRHRGGGGGGGSGGGGGGGTREPEGGGGGGGAPEAAAAVKQSFETSSSICTCKALLPSRGHYALLQMYY